MGMGKIPPCAMVTGGVAPSIMGIGGLSPCAIGTRGFPPVCWNMKKYEEHEQYEVHSLWERYDQMKLESIQPFSQPMFGLQLIHGIHIQRNWYLLDSNFD